MIILVIRGMKIAQTKDTELETKDNNKIINDN